MRTNSSLLPAMTILLIWGAISIYLAQAGLYRNAPDEPPIVVLLSVIGPPIVFAILYRLSRRVREYSLGLDLQFLTAVQAWRILGGMFLVLLLYDLVPSTFAWPAGVGDMIVGLYAPFVVYAIARRSPNWRTHVVLLNILGLLDFLGAVGMGVLSGNSPIGIFREDVTTDVFQRLPLSLIPNYAVPAWIIMHMISLLKCAQPTEEGDLARALEV
jgi:hypothetical protein